MTPFGDPYDPAQQSKYNQVAAEGETGNGAIRYDAEKTRYDLVPPEALEAVARVYTWGAKKYAPRNWEKGMEWGRCYAALQRHVQSFWAGYDLDDESNLLHLAHVAWNAMALLQYQLKGIGIDDRPNRKEE